MWGQTISTPLPPLKPLNLMKVNKDVALPKGHHFESLTGQYYIYGAG